ncbi:PilN family type IVB pilus formation outer membrane protein [Hydrogenophaga sp. BPS33]|uniref:PilN family type IVB pilus formation outer membrane protein n=1 Tax=Hydrogenophaga sp. BPS33 TaxID=2651974 RepID=UPI00131FC395|nr:PilN family type IVB pilus formation outer membrane protein [Hydrogenophaga sp. BPS33]QHE89340.1 PilN family type IVB pilus formation outer membrane protein [Hydrogenophaga sp. BPS33]
MTKTKKTILATMMIATLAGCSTATMKPVVEKVDAVGKEAQSALRAVRDTTAMGPVVATSVRRVDRVWIPVSKMAEAKDPRAEAALNRSFAVNRRFDGLVDSASYLSQITGIVTSVSRAARKNAEAEVSSSETPASPSGTPANSSQAPLPPLPSGTVQANGSAAGSRDAVAAPVVYSGSVRGFLDLMASKYGVFWEWDGMGVHFFVTKSATFRLAALPGDTSLQARVGTQSNTTTGVNGNSSNGSASGSASSEMRAGVEFSGMSVWKGIEDSIKAMLSPDGRLVVTPSTGTITVDDTPVVIERLARFVDAQNASLSRQVSINVKVLAVELSDSDQYGINWEAVYQSVNRSVGLTLSSAAEPIIGASSFGMRILSPTSNWNGTEAMVEALSKQGRVSQVTSASLLTINNQPAPIQVGRQTAYLASSTTTLGTGGAGNTTTLQPGQVTTGFSLNTLPHILDDKRLMLQFSGDISSLLGIDQVVSGGSSIQTPEIDTRNFLQRTILNSGETLVVTGFEQLADEGRSAGVGKATNVALGGSVRASKTRNVLVVLIQPIVAGAR